MLWNREGLYASHLRRWYRPRERGACYGAIRVGKELEQAKAVVEIQKKSARCLAAAARPKPGSYEGEGDATASDRGRESGLSVCGHLLCQLRQKPASGDVGAQAPPLTNH